MTRIKRLKRAYRRSLKGNRDRSWKRLRDERTRLLREGR